jgi:PTS system nitrogen regulatory IIA component
MITIESLLPLDHIALDLAAETPQAAIDEVAALVKNHPAVIDWEAMRKGVHGSAPCLPENAGAFSICLPHTRGECVSRMVMSVGRSAAGIAFSGVEFPVHYIFCIAVPRALAADYLRIVGLLARIFKDPAAERELRAATAASVFIEHLSRREAKL